MDYLDEMEQFARANKIPVILQDTRAFLENLCKTEQPQNILEIGMAIGYSGSCMLRSCDAHLTCCEASLPNIALARENFEKLRLANRVSIVTGDCLRTLPTLRGRTFNLIFLDGPKGLYLEILDLLLPLLDKHGVLIADNVLFRGMVEDGQPILEPRFVHTVEVMRQFIDRLQHDKRFITKVHHIGDGLCEVRYRG